MANVPAVRLGAAGQPRKFRAEGNAVLNPDPSRTLAQENSMTNHTAWRRSCIVCIAVLLSAAVAIPLPAQTFRTLMNFNVTNGSQPASSLVQGMDGEFYGTTFYGGNITACGDGCGTIFKITSGGSLRTLHEFDGTDGAGPGAVIQATDGHLYGTTGFEGANTYGTVFKISLSGTLSTLYNLEYSDGFDAVAPLVQATNGNLYGTAYDGGASAYPGYGTIFEITRAGAPTTLFSFSVASPNGSNPAAGLVQAVDGNLYGTTAYVGVSLAGTVFKITPGGTLTTLHSFAFTDGANPFGGLIQATDGNFYGTTEDFGANGDGTVFRMTPDGTLTTLHSFDYTDGARIYAGLIQATDGDFYGTTEAGGADGYGTIFKITPTGKLKTLHSFDSTDGANPTGGLVQGTDGNLYGTTSGGGAHAGGTVFKLSVGLGPFVNTLPASGKVGTAIEILGTDLTGATGVTFNGAAAAFTVVSPSLITTTVPAGATTGKVQVTTPGGTLLSNVTFRVRP